MSLYADAKELDELEVRIADWRNGDTREFPYSSAELDAVIRTARRGIEDTERLDELQRSGWKLEGRPGNQGGFTVFSLTRWKMVLLDAVLCAGLCWIPVLMYAVGNATAMPRWMLWGMTGLGAVLGPVQFAVLAIAEHRRPTLSGVNRE